MERHPADVTSKLVNGKSYTTAMPRSSDRPVRQPRTGDDTQPNPAGGQRIRRSPAFRTLARYAVIVERRRAGPVVTMAGTERAFCTGDTIAILTYYVTSLNLIVTHRTTSLPVSRQPGPDAEHGGVKTDDHP